MHAHFFKPMLFLSELRMREIRICYNPMQIFNQLSFHFTPHSFALCYFIQNQSVMPFSEQR